MNDAQILIETLTKDLLDLLDEDSLDESTKDSLEWAIRFSRAWGEAHRKIAQLRDRSKREGNLEKAVICASCLAFMSESLEEKEV